MDRFEHLSVLISIVIGIGLSSMASAWGRMLRQRARVRLDGLRAFWSLFVVLLMVQFWWGFWEFRGIETWSFGGLLATVAEALVLVLAALVLTPDDPVGQQPFWHPENAVRVPRVVIAFALASSGNERLHRGLAIVAGVLFLVFLGVTFTR